MNDTLEKQGKRFKDKQTPKLNKPFKIKVNLSSFYIVTNKACEKFMVQYHCLADNVNYYSRWGRVTALQSYFAKRQKRELFKGMGLTKAEKFGLPLGSRNAC